MSLEAMVTAVRLFCCYVVAEWKRCELGKVRNSEGHESEGI